MLKRALLILGYCGVTIWITARGMSFGLSYAVLFPFLLFPLFLMIEFFPRFWALGFCLPAGSYLFYAFQHVSQETGLIGAEGACLLAACFFYRRHWQNVLIREMNSSAKAREELENLKEKHHSRLESLHHLEKQVAGLLGLFEIARDFNDTLSYETVQELLSKRVMPELPFRRLRIFLFEPGQTVDGSVCAVSACQETSYQTPLPNELSEEEKRQVELIRQTKRMIQNGNNLSIPLLADGETVAAMLVEGIQPDDLAKYEVLSAYMALQVRKIKFYETVKELSIRDGLTGVFVRRHFYERFDEELKRSIKYGLPLAVLILDIDLFKRYNDEYGHLAGDATLKQVAQILCDSLRKVDLVARYGGEEFAVVIPDSRKSGAAEVAERIRSTIARHQFKVFNDQTKVTVSIGVALFPEDSPEENPADTRQLALELIQRADKALYRGKEEGRNRVVFYQDL